MCDKSSISNFFEVVDDLSGGDHNVDFTFADASNSMRDVSIPIRFDSYFTFRINVNKLCDFLSRSLSHGNDRVGLISY